ncbi:uncharacterized protein LOC127431697 [Myxocyprinus asiaticus]|uniref:uncharacterized protein LOC127431697 n=1 Tax=Myxocyprinus asiaticus TaxID=70543 RepID=UPI002223CD15|nr:uncharacterized protein LOC127431697 [Myxocyprinus asiaticus]
MVERVNRTIKENISKQIMQHNNRWTEALPTVLTVLRATPSKATGISPFELMTGRVMKLPIDPEITPADLGPLVLASQQTVLKQLQERLKVLHTQATLKQQQSDLINDAQFNPTSEIKFAEGDMIMDHHSDSMETGHKTGVRAHLHQAGPKGIAHAHIEMWEMGVEILKGASHTSNYHYTKRNSYMASRRNAGIKLCTTNLLQIRFHPSPDHEHLNTHSSVAILTQHHCLTRIDDLISDYKGAARQEILDLRLCKTPRHVLNDLMEILDLRRWLASEKMKGINYSKLLSTVMMYTGAECSGCLGFLATFPLIHPDQVFPNSTTIRPIGVVVKDQIVKWDHLTGYMTVRGTETLFTSRTCCHETHNYVICTCNTLQPFSSNDTKLINVQSLHGHSDAIQVSHTQWCVVSEMSSFSYGGLTCPANHSFCLEVTEDFSMGQINILGRIPLDTKVSPWWDDTFYEHSTQAVADTMDLAQRMILQTEYHLNQAQIEKNLAKRTAQILSSSSTRSALYAYTWWDWVFRGCAIGSAFIFTFTLLQCCYFRYLIGSLRTSTNAALALSPLHLHTLQQLR